MVTDDGGIVVRSGNLTVGSVTAGAMGDVSLEVAGAISDDGDSSTGVTADKLKVEAAGSIKLGTDVASLDATASGGGLIEIEERDGFTLTSVVAGGGRVTVSAGSISLGQYFL